MPRRQSWTLARSLDQGPSAGPYRRWGKRAFDLSAASVGLLVLSPILLLCAVLVRLTSRGPVFFRQKRLALHGRTFTVLKLPTMRVGADRSGSSLAVPGEQGLTPIGNFVRRTNLDELPQLFNVLRGDMSPVGARPRVPDLVNLDNPEERMLLSVRAGLTSYASLCHRMEEKYCLRQEHPKAAYREI